MRDVISTSKARGQVEKWLLELEGDMISSLQKVITECKDDYAKCDRKEWVRKWPGQAVLCVDLLYWTSILNILNAIAHDCNRYNNQIVLIVLLVSDRTHCSLLNEYNHLTI